MKSSAWLREDWVQRHGAHVEPRREPDREGLVWEVSWKVGRVHCHAFGATFREAVDDARRFELRTMGNEMSRVFTIQERDERARMGFEMDRQMGIERLAEARARAGCTE